MNRIMTALALSGLFVAAPAFAKSHASSSKSVATAGDKAAAATRPPARPRPRRRPTRPRPTTDGAKPVKKVKKSQEGREKTEGSSEKPAEAPAK